MKKGYYLITGKKIEVTGSVIGKLLRVIDSTKTVEQLKMVLDWFKNIDHNFNKVDFNLIIDHVDMRLDELNNLYSDTWKIKT